MASNTDSSARSLANFSAGSGSLPIYEVCATRLWAELATGEWDVDMVKARSKTLQKYFIAGTAPADSSTARLVVGKIDSPGCSEYEPRADDAEDAEEEEKVIDEEEDAEDAHSTAADAVDDAEDPEEEKENEEDVDDIDVEDADNDAGNM